MSCAAYLGIYEPVAAFHEPERSRWAAYAASTAQPRRRDSLAVEHAEALQRAITAPQIVVPDQETEHAYIRRSDGVTYICPARAETELGEVGRWLEEFHPYSLVELDYGGLVQLLSDDALSSDQSAAEIAAAIDGVAKGERELAVAMYKRAQSRWRAFAEYEMAN